MALRKISLQYLKNVSFKNYSSQAVKLTNTEINEKTGIATVTLQRPPVNSLNLELITELKTTINDLEKNKTRGIILTSSSKSVFSAGLDILELYQPKPERLTSFWTSLQDLWITLYGTPLPTVAVINGHSPAGGCLIAMATEYRIMLPNFTIGLNESLLGISAPTWFADTMVNTIGVRQSEIALTTGRLFNTEEALNVGLIDEIANSKDEGIKKAEEFLSKFAKIALVPRAITKKSVRGDTINKMVKGREGDLQHFISFVSNEAVQKSLGMYLENLKKRAAK